MSPEEHNDLELKLIGSGQYPEFTDDDINALRLAISGQPHSWLHLLSADKEKPQVFCFWLLGVLISRLATETFIILHTDES